MLLQSDSEYSEYKAAVECAKAYCEETSMQVVIMIDHKQVNSITCEYDEDDKSWCVLQEENDKNLYKFFSKELDNLWIDEHKRAINTKIKELEERRDLYMSIIRRNSMHVMVADDHDDVIQDYLEASWELRDIDEELDHLNYELEILDK